MSQINQALDDYKHSLIDLGTAHSAIISLILEKIPKEYESIENDSGFTLMERVGWNNCLTEMRERIKEI